MTQQMKYFHEDEPKGKFIAIFSDGSGCSLFQEDGTENGVITFTQVHDKIIRVTSDWFEDAGYFYWMPLPDDFEIFGEVK